MAAPVDKRLADGMCVRIPPPRAECSGRGGESDDTVKLSVLTLPGATPLAADEPAAVPLAVAADIFLAQNGFRADRARSAGTLAGLA